MFFFALWITSSSVVVLTRPLGVVFKNDTGNSSVSTFSETMARNGSIKRSAQHDVYQKYEKDFTSEQLSHTNNYTMRRNNALTDFLEALANLLNLHQYHNDGQLNMKNDRVENEPANGKTETVMVSGILPTSTDSRMTFTAAPQSNDENRVTIKGLRSTHPQQSINTEISQSFYQQTSIRTTTQSLHEQLSKFTTAAHPSIHEHINDGIIKINTNQRIFISSDMGDSSDFSSDEDVNLDNNHVIVSTRQVPSTSIIQTAPQMRTNNDFAESDRLFVSSYSSSGELSERSPETQTTITTDEAGTQIDLNNPVEPDIIINSLADMINVYNRTAIEIADTISTTETSEATVSFHRHDGDLLTDQSNTTNEQNISEYIGSFGDKKDELKLNVTFNDTNGEQEADDNINSVNTTIGLHGYEDRLHVTEVPFVSQAVTPYHSVSMETILSQLLFYVTDLRNSSINEDVIKGKQNNEDIIKSVKHNSKVHTQNKTDAKNLSSGNEHIVPSAISDVSTVPIMSKQPYNATHILQNILHAENENVSIANHSERETLDNNPNLKNSQENNSNVSDALFSHESGMNSNEDGKITQQSITYIPELYMSVIDHDIMSLSKANGLSPFKNNILAHMPRFSNLSTIFAHEQSSTTINIPASSPVTEMSESQHFPQSPNPTGSSKPDSIATSQIIRREFKANTNLNSAVHMHSPSHVTSTVLQDKSYFPVAAFLYLSDVSTAYSNLSPTFSSLHTAQHPVLSRTISSEPTENKQTLLSRYVLSLLSTSPTPTQFKSTTEGATTPQKMPISTSHLATPYTPTSQGESAPQIMSTSPVTKPYMPTNQQVSPPHMMPIRASTLTTPSTPSHSKANPKYEIAAGQESIPMWVSLLYGRSRRVYRPGSLIMVLLSNRLPTLRADIHFTKDN